MGQLRIKPRVLSIEALGDLASAPVILPLSSCSLLSSHTGSLAISQPPRTLLPLGGSCSLCLLIDMQMASFKSLLEYHLLRNAGHTLHSSLSSSISFFVHCLFSPLEHQLQISETWFYVLLFSQCLEHCLIHSRSSANK